MIGLHVVDYEIIDGTIPNDSLYLTEELFGVTDIYGIYKGDLLIHNKIRVVAYPMGEWPHAFEEIFGAIVYTYVVNRRGNVYLRNHRICIKSGFSFLFSLGEEQPLVRGDAARR